MHGKLGWTTPPSAPQCCDFCYQYLQILKALGFLMTVFKKQKKRPRTSMFFGKACIHAYIHIHTSIHPYIHACMHAYIHTYIYIYISIIELN